MRSRRSIFVCMESLDVEVTAVIKIALFSAAADVDFSSVEADV